ncbi:MAG TPA: serine/threonine-protein kinase [Planctomycetota bacterium]|nr:serine/threonine-protein kinase [Planctomycetota bacterium]
MSTPGRLGDFEIVDEIGRGGFGVVYRAAQVSLDRPVAVKVLYRHLIHTQEQITRFEREARAAARLDHPALVSVYAWGEAAGDFFIAQRLIGSGRTLADELKELRESGQPPKGHFRRMAEVCARVAEGLQHAHERGIVHRDVKPSNILLDEHAQPCLGDFGLAKVEDGLELSRTGDFAGSPYYMSPEQADSRRGSIGAQSDIYSLGVTLYEMLTLTQPFQGTTSHEIVRRILSEEPARPARLEPRVPPDLETICLKAMEKTAARRYATAGELAADLQAYLDGEPIAAVPISTTRRVMRAARRHREPIMLAALGVLVVCGGWWASMRLRQSQGDTNVADAGRVVQESRADDLLQLQTQMAERIQEAASRPEEVMRLSAQQQAATQFYDDSYKWAQQQLNGIRSNDEVSKVATGFATGGLAGGLQGLQSVFAGRQVSDERDSVLAELERRLKLVNSGMPEAQSPATTPTAAAPPPASGAPKALHVPSPLTSLPCVLSADGSDWLWISGFCQALVPLSLVAPPAGAPASSGLEQARGSATAPVIGTPNDGLPPLQPPRASERPEGQGTGWLPRLPW